MANEEKDKTDFSPTDEQINAIIEALGGNKNTVKIKGEPQFMGVGRAPRETYENMPVTEAKQLFEKAFITGNTQAYNKIVKSIGPGFTFNQYRAIWSRAVDNAAIASMDPYDVLKNENFRLGVIGSYKGGAKEYTPTANIRQYTPQQAKNTAIEAFRAYLQRNPTNQELAEFTKDLNAAAARNPTVTTTKMVNGTAVTTTKGQFDEASWARGYLAARYKNETDSLASRSREDLLNTAKAYGVNMGDAWYKRAGNQIMKGQDPEKYIDDIRKAAASRYTAFSDRILAGDTLEQIASPYLQSYASTLELNPYDLDVMDPTIQQALLNTDDAGQNRPINLFEFERNLKKDPRWQQTRNAQQQYSGLATRILQDFGLLG